jgi:hypothetical protein
MTPETDENGSGSGAPRKAEPTSRRRGASLTAAAIAFGTIVVPVALGLILGIGYLGYADVQREREIKAQHAELESLKDKIPAAHGRTDIEQSQPSTSEIQGLQNHVVPAAHGRTDIEQSQPSTSEIQGLQNHVEALRGQAKRQKK